MKTDKRFIVYPASFLVIAGISMLNFSVIFFMRRTWDSSPAFIGWMSAFWAAAYLAGCQGLGWLTKRLGYARSLPLSMLIMGASSVLLFRSPSGAAAFFWYMVFGFFTALHWPPVMGWLSEGVEGPQLSKWVSGFNLSWSLGLGLGPWLAGMLLEQNLSLPFVAIAMIYLSVFLLYAISLFPKLRHIRPAPLESSKSEIKPPPAENRTKVGSPFRWAGWIGVGSSYVILGVSMFIFPMFAHDALGYSESFTGMLLLIRSLVTVGSFWLLGRIHFWHHRRWVVPAFQGALIVSAGGVWLARSSAAYMAVFALFGLVFALQYVYSIFHGVSGAHDHERERRMAIHESSLTAGQIIGAAGGGIVYGAFDFGTVMGATAGLLVIAGVFQWLTLVGHRIK